MEVLLALQVAEEKVINAWYEFHKLGILRPIQLLFPIRVRMGILMFRKLYCRLVRWEAIPSIPVQFAMTVIPPMRRRLLDTVIRHRRPPVPVRAADIRHILVRGAATAIREIKLLLRDIAFPQVLPIRLAQAQAIRHTPARSADITTRTTKRSRSDTVTQQQRKIRPVRKRGTRPINVRGAA